MNRREFLQFLGAAGSGAGLEYLLASMGWPSVARPALQVPERVGMKKVENSWYDYVFSQICGMVLNQDTAETGDLIFACAEPWARLPFPGGCGLERNNYLGTGTCAVTVAAYVTNLRVPTEVILEKTGYPGLTPDMVAWMIYPHVVPNFQVTCGGAGVELLYPTFKYFELTPETVTFSDYTLPGMVDNLPKNQDMVVAFKGYKWNAERTDWQVAQHYQTVTYSAKLPNGFITVGGPDSYYYLKPPVHPTNVIKAFDMSQWEKHRVVVLESSVIRKNPNKPNGTEYYYVGAFTVTTPKSWGDIESVYVEPVNSDGRIGKRRVSWPPDAKIVSQPVLIGPDRWQVEIDKRGEPGNFVYYSDRGEGFPFGEEFNFRYRYYQLPAYMQLDPRWGLVGSGQAVTASLLSAKIGSEVGGEVTPDGVHRRYFGGRRQIETEIGELVPIWKSGGYMEKKIETVDDIYATLRRGELVVLQGRVNFGWWNARSENVDQHYQLFWGLNKSGDILAYDPLWGLFPIRRQELQFYDIRAMLALGRTPSAKLDWKRR